MKTGMVTTAALALALAISSFPFSADAAPLDQIGVKSGSIHRIALGAGEITARVVETGKDGWVLFSITSDDVRWKRGTRLWINLDQVGNISAAMTAAETASAGVSASPATATPAATLTDAEIAALPCFSQVEARDARAIAKGQSFDRNQFLTECILNQRKKP